MVSMTGGVDLSRLCCGQSKDEVQLRAVSVGISRLSDNQKLSIKFSASTSVSKGKATVSAGAGVGLHF